MPTVTTPATGPSCRSVHGRAMGSDLHLLVVGGRPDLLERAGQRIKELEERWSRFRPDSEISRLNAGAGAPLRVSSATLGLVRHALDGARVSGGRYDPTVLGDVLRAGYDRSFELLTDQTVGGSPLGQGWDRIVVDPASLTVTLPPGVGFDPGGIGKGYAADLLAEELLADGAAGACVNLGGDLRVDGVGPAGGSWVIAVQHPWRPGLVATLTLERGAVATSSRVRRSWGPREERRHHLIDPSTGRPARSGLAAVTVVAAHGWQAEVLAKAAFVSGTAGGLALLAATGTAGLLVDDVGRPHPSAGFDRFTGRAQQPDHEAPAKVAG